MVRLRNILFSVLAIFICVGTFAENVARKDAKKIAETFFNTIYGQKMAQPEYVWNGKQLTTNRLFTPFYVFNHPKGGFVIISADSKAYPILGYSRTGKFNPQRISEDEREWYKAFAMQIELIRYDSRYPTLAAAAWQDLPGYITKVIENPYDTPEFNQLSESRKETLEQIDRRNNSVIMPAAIEFDLYNPENYREYSLDDVLAEEDEEIPFSFYENFIADISKEEALRQAALDEIISPTRPIVTNHGGAHYTILFPDDVRLVRIYSMTGARMSEKYFKNTNSVNLDLSSLPQGFYAMLAQGENGKVYGFKLYR